MASSDTSLTSLMIVVSIAFLIPIMLHKLKLRMIPVVVAEIIAGIIIGKSGLNIVSDGSWLDNLSLLGLIYLMFLSGLEIDFNSFQSGPFIKKGEIRPLRTAVILFTVILILSFVLALSMVWMGLIREPFLMTLIVATISLGVVVPVLKEKHLLDTSEGQTALLITVMSDFITMILLTVYLGLQAKNHTQVLLLFIFFIVVFIIYRFIKRFLKGRLFEALGRGTIQLGTRAVFALILLFVVLSQNFGAESILGAFLAGLIVSLLTPDKNFIRQLDSFGYGFLIPIFFVMVGVKLKLWELISDPKILVLLPIMMIAMYAAKIIPILWLRRWFAWRKVFGIGVLLSSKLSLAIAAATVASDMNFIDSNMKGALILGAVLTCLISPISFNRIFPKEEEKKRPSIGIFGLNPLTVPVAKDLYHEGFDVTIFRLSDMLRTPGQPRNGRLSEELTAAAHDTPSAEEADMDAATEGAPELSGSSSLSQEQIPENSQNSALDDLPIEIKLLTDTNHLSQEADDVLRMDSLIYGTEQEKVNIQLAETLHSLGMKKNVVRVDRPDQHTGLSEKGFVLFSTLHASQTMLKALIEHPSSVRLITQRNDAIQEVEVNSPTYEGMAIRNLPHLEDTLILRIYRGHSDIIPHGNTLIQIGDRLLVSGRAESIQRLKHNLE